MAVSSICLPQALMVALPARGCFVALLRGGAALLGGVNGVALRAVNLAGPNRSCRCT